MRIRGALRKDGLSVSKSEWGQSKEEDKHIGEEKLDEGFCDTLQREPKKRNISDCWLSLWLGLAIVILSLGTFFGNDIPGMGMNNEVWTDGPFKPL